MKPMVELLGVSKQFGATPAVRDISFAVEDGEVVCLLGPSGCGKTTTLRMIAGLESPTSGTVLIDGVDVTVWPPYARNIGLVFQDYALFPHMTVRENVAFGLRHRGVPKTAIPEQVANALSLVKLSGYETRRPSQLSGGEQQRVAIARALVTRPKVLLLDEPLSNLDAKLRAELRVQMRAILEEVRTTTVMVTHDQDEAMSLGDRIVVMSRGVIEQTGRPVEIYDSPSSRFVAEFIGRSNWFSGTMMATSEEGLGHFALEGGGSVLVSLPRSGNGQHFDLCLRPERLVICLRDEGRRKHADRRGNCLSGQVRHVETLGPQLYVHVLLESGHMVLAVLPRASGADYEGAAVDVMFRPEDALLVPKDALRD